MKNLVLITALILGSLSWSYAQNILPIAPFDRDSIKTQYPLFSWSYLGQRAANNERDFYRFILVELLDDKQTAEAGIVMNRPIIKMDFVAGTQFFYPYDAPELEKGKRYAWQVQRIQNKVLVDKSEAWWFIIPLEPIIPIQYYKITTKHDGQLYRTIENKMHIEFYEAYSQKALNYYVVNEKGEKIETKIYRSIFNKEPELNGELSPGANFLIIDLGNVPDGIYELVIVDAKRRKYKMKFVVKNS